MTTVKFTTITALLIVAIKADYIAPPPQAISPMYGVPSTDGGDYGGYSTTGGNGGYSTVGGGYGSGNVGGYGSGGHEEEHHQAHPYEFGYAVKDPHYGTDFGQQEASDGNNVKGQYRVVLPDGRTQIVTYHADWKTGFHADVKYEGEARYPEPNQHHGNGGYQQYGVPPPPPANDYHTTADFGGQSGGGYRR